MEKIYKEQILEAQICMERIYEGHIYDLSNLLAPTYVVLICGERICNLLTYRGMIWEGFLFEIPEIRRGKNGKR